jgi:hypothetical protein
MRIVRLAALLAMLGCSQRASPPGRSGSTTAIAAFAAHVERANARPSARASARGGIHSVIVEGTVPAPCAGAPPLVQSYGPVDSAVVVRVSQSVPALCEPGAYAFSFTAVAQWVAPGRVPVEVTWTVTTGDPRARSMTQVLLRDTVTVLP